MADHKIVIRKPDQKTGYTALYESDKQEAEKEAEKFRRGEFFKDLLTAGYIVEVQEVKDDR